MRQRTAVFLLSIIMLAVLRVGTMQAQNEKKEAPPPPPEPNIKVGDTFPDFTLLDQNRNKVSLHDFKGKKNVVVAFAVFAFTGG
jgi:cytochrome oxidase Cu insertion factor (SCO1/SenC/PrrC family)